MTIGINPQTGNIWINNYLLMYGTLFSNQKHPYIQLPRYYDIVGRLEGKTKSAYAMILHSHIAQTICNRKPGIKSSIFMYIDNGKGSINNSTEMKEWMLQSDWMNCNGAHLLEIASAEVWWIVYKALLDVGLLATRAGTLRAMVPINGRMLPIPYAYVAFLSRLKKDVNLKSQIQKALSDTPNKIKANLENLPKEDLINELIRIKTRGLNTSKKGELFKMLFDEVSTKYPHGWNNSSENIPEKNRENFFQKISEKIPEKIMENFSEKNPENFSENNSQEITVENIIEKIPEKISKEISKKNLRPTKTLLPEDIHNFESNKKTRNRISAPKKESNPTIEESLFFADDVTGKDAKKIVEKIPENNLEENFQDFSIFDFDDEDIASLDTDTDIFGIPTEEYDLENIPDIPELAKPNTDDEEDFWAIED